MSILMQVDSRHFSGRLLPATAGHKAPRYADNIRAQEEGKGTVLTS